MRQRRCAEMGLAAAVLVMAGWFAYGNSFGAPFVFDDVPSILENPTIRDPTNLVQMLRPPSASGITVSGRPVVNVTLAVNHAFGGTSVTGYHIGNLLVHTAAALLLFALVRRVLELPSIRPPVRGRMASVIALVVALLWLVHPLNTESVTYVAQRAEALMGLMLFTALYAFVRGAGETAAANGWLAVSAMACALGMATKESMAAAPLVIAIFDRTLFAGTFRLAWNLRRLYYVALFSSWILLAACVVASGGRGGTVGIQSAITPLDYLLVQFWAVVRYARLAVFPLGLVFDYGTDIAKNFVDVLPQMVVVGIAIALAMLALRRGTLTGAVAFIAAAVLAPTSTVIPIASQYAAEHRMYVPLAAILAFLVVGAFRLVGRTAVIAGFCAAVPLSLTTRERNEVYHDPIALWSDTVAWLPGNTRAHYNLALGLANQGRYADALPHYETVMARHPRDYETETKLGDVLARLGQSSEAMAHFRAALAVAPDYPEAHNNLAVALARSGNPREAIPHFRAAVAARPSSFELHANLGSALLAAGRPAEALAELETAARLRPDDTVIRGAIEGLRQGR